MIGLEKEVSKDTYVHDVGFGRRDGKTVCGKDYSKTVLNLTTCLARVTCPDCKSKRGY